MTINSNRKRTPRKMNFMSGMISLYLSLLLFDFLVETLEFTERPMEVWLALIMACVATLLLIAGSYLVADFVERLSCAYQYSLRTS